MENTFEQSFLLFESAVRGATNEQSAVVAELLRDDLAELLRRFFAEKAKTHDKSIINVAVSDVDEALRQAGDLVATVEDGVYFVLVGDPAKEIRAAIISRLGLWTVIQQLLQAEVTVSAICLRTTAGITLDVCVDGTNIEFAATCWAVRSKERNQSGQD